MITGEPRNIIVNPTTGSSEFVYELSGMFKFHKCSTEERGKLAVFTLAKIEYAIALAIVAG